VLGFSVPQHHSFYGLPWFTGLAGMPRVGGPTLMQACATGVRTLLAAVQEIESGLASAALAITADRTSNGPHVYYPNPKGPGGTGGHEDWVLDNFGCDPLGRHSMVETAENVARKHGFTTAQQHEVVLRREAQFRDATANGAACWALHDPAARACRQLKAVATMTATGHQPRPEGLKLKP
jgi:acetyl-CoA acetyltransferase